jgi:hypothetical protein
MPTLHALCLFLPGKGIVNIIVDTSKNGLDDAAMIHDVRPEANTRLDNQLSRSYCHRVSVGFSSGGLCDS